MDGFQMMLLITVFIYGIVIGSFLNVCIYRIPAGESIVRVRSHCTGCNYQLQWFDLIPLVSWLCYKGRCRKCGRKISVQYPLIEFFNGILYVLIFVMNGYGSVRALLLSVLYCLMTSALLALSVIDWRTYEIPFGFNVFLFVLGLIRVGLDTANWLEYVIGFFAVSAFLEVLYWLSGGKAIGGGDIRLMAACGLILGWKNIVLAFVLGCIIGSVIHLFRMKVSGAQHVLAMGPYLSVGILLAALWGDGMIQGYLNMIGWT